MAFIKSLKGPIIILLLVLLPMVLIYYDYNYADIRKTTPDFSDVANITPSKPYEKNVIELPSQTFIFLTVTRKTSNAEVLIYLMTETSYEHYKNRELITSQYTDDLLVNDKNSLTMNYTFVSKVNLYLVILLETDEDSASFDIYMSFVFDAYYIRKGYSIFIFIGMYIAIVKIVESQISNLHKNKAVKDYEKDILEKENQFYDNLIDKMNNHK